jgi:hypothetical protein
MLASPPASCAPRTVLLAPVKVPHDSVFSAIPVSLWGAPFLSCSITLLLTHSNTHTLSLPCARSLSRSLSRTRAISLSRFSWIACRFACTAFRFFGFVSGFVKAVVHGGLIAMPRCHRDALHPASHASHAS